MKIRKSNNQQPVKPAHEILQQQSYDAVATIRNLIQTLRSLGENASAEKAQNLEKIESIKAENAALDKVISGNARIADNFEKLIS